MKRIQIQYDKLKSSAEESHFRLPKGGAERAAPASPFPKPKADLQALAPSYATAQGVGTTSALKQLWGRLCLSQSLHQRVDFHTLSSLPGWFREAKEISITEQPAAAWFFRAKLRLSFLLIGRWIVTKRRFMRRNYGYAVSLEVAIKIVIQEQSRSYSSIRSKQGRLHLFLDFLKQCKIEDLRKIQFQTIESFGNYMRRLVEEKGLSIAYGQNVLSDVNWLMRRLRGKESFRLSPSHHLGRRRWIRESAPSGLDVAVVGDCVSQLFREGHERAAVIVLIARFFGLRLREAVLADLPRLTREAKTKGYIQVREGTKGGRKVDRPVAVDDFGLWILRQALLLAREDGQRCLIPVGMNYKKMLANEIARARSTLQTFGIKGFHDLRSAFACDRYFQLTKVPAPVLSGGRCVSADADRDARAAISLELGHNRLEVAASYIGSRRPSPGYRETEAREKEDRREQLARLRVPIDAQSISQLVGPVCFGKKSQRQQHIRRLVRLLCAYAENRGIRKFSELILDHLREISSREAGQDSGRSVKTRSDYLLSLIRLIHTLGHPDWEVHLRDAAGLRATSAAGRKVGINRRKKRGEQR